MAAPSVYTAINAVTDELAACGIPKTHTNSVGQYRYRSIDDVLNCLAPLLAKHRLCVMPRVLDRQVAERVSVTQELLLSVTVRAEFVLVSVDDGSSHAVQTYGEALDPADKATAKAMSAAYKAAMIQTFCIPAPGNEDADGNSVRLSARTHVPEPVQGWGQWVRDISDIVGVCETPQALDLVLERNRELLKALIREQSEDYSRLGEVFAARRAALSRSEKSPAPQPISRVRPTRKSRETALPTASD